MPIRWFVVNGLLVCFAAAAYVFRVPYVADFFAFSVCAFTFVGGIMFMALKYVHHVVPASHKGRLTPNIDRPMFQPKTRLMDICFDVVLSVFVGLYAPWVAVVYFLHTVFLQLCIDTLIHLKRGYREEISV